MSSGDTFSHVQLSKYLAEFLGTGFLILTIKVSVADLNDVKSDLGSFAIGFVLMVVIYQYGYISGAHFNPAVTLGIVARGGTKSFPSNNWPQICMYWLSQFLGGFLGGMYSWTIGGKRACLIYPELDHSLFWPIQGFMCELTFTFLLVSSVLHTGISQAGNSFYGITIGLTLFVAVLAINTVTGCAINPAVYLGTTLPALCCKSWYGESVTGHVQTEYFWIYLLAEPIGAIMAGFYFRYVYGIAEFGNQLDKFANVDTNINSEMLTQQLLPNDSKNQDSNVMLTSIQNL